jgi:glycosyltransferase involved in cell wall biosynthesis
VIEVDSAEPTIWMDVTTSYRWSRPPVGIVRVELEIRKALSDIYGDRLRECVYNDGEFQTFAEVHEVTEVTDVQGLAGRAVTENGLFWPQRSHDFPRFSVLEGVSSKVTAEYAHVLKPTVLEKISASPMKYGDILITVGLDWDYEGLTDTLYRLKTGRGVKIVTCCYDLIPVLFPQYCVGDVAAKFKNYFGILSWSSDLMLCISRKTEEDYLALADVMGLPHCQTDVIPLGAVIAKGEGECSDDVLGLIEEPFILFVSTIERRKNHEVLYKAYHLLCAEGHREFLPKLVFVGMPGWGVGDLLKDIELDPLIKGLIVQLHHVSDADLANLYEHCQFFVYPSFYEGWGLPIAEALAHGKCVLASDRGAIPEVGGALVEYVDPWSVRSWADAILSHVRSPELRAAREAEVRRSYRPVEWRDVGGQVARDIDRLAQRGVEVIELEPGYSLQTDVGVRAGGRIISTGEAGLLAFGPCRPVGAGKVHISLAYHYMGGQAGTLTANLKSCPDGELHQEICEKLDGEESCGILDFPAMILPDTVEDVNISVNLSDGVHVYLDKLTIVMGKN